MCVYAVFVCVCCVCSLRSSSRSPLSLRFVYADGFYSKALSMLEQFRSVESSRLQRHVRDGRRFVRRQMGREDADGES